MRQKVLFKAFVPPQGQQKGWVLENDYKTPGTMIKILPPPSHDHPAFAIIVTEDGKIVEVGLERVKIAPTTNPKPIPFAVFYIVAAPFVLYVIYMILKAHKLL